MGNRAVITFETLVENGEEVIDPNAIGIYLHWLGGRDTVEAFLDATRSIMDGRRDAPYAMARLMHVIGTGIPGNLSFGLGKCCDLDCTGDNGVYVVDAETMEITSRLNYGYEEQNMHDGVDFTANILRAIRASEAIFNAPKP